MTHALVKYAHVELSEFDFTRGYDFALSGLQNSEN
jgi:hypothetical protein